MAKAKAQAKTGTNGRELGNPNDEATQLLVLAAALTRAGKNVGGRLKEIGAASAALPEGQYPYTFDVTIGPGTIVVGPETTTAPSPNLGADELLAALLDEIDDPVIWLASAVDYVRAKRRSAAGKAELTEKVKALRDEINAHAKRCRMMTTGGTRRGAVSGGGALHAEGTVGTQGVGSSGLTLDVAAEGD